MSSAKFSGSHPASVSVCGAYWGNWSSAEIISGQWESVRLNQAQQRLFGLIGGQRSSVGSVMYIHLLVLMNLFDAISMKILCNFDVLI